MSCTTKPVSPVLVACGSAYAALPGAWEKNNDLQTPHLSHNMVTLDVGGIHPQLLRLPKKTQEVASEVVSISPSRTSSGIASDGNESPLCQTDEITSSVLASECSRFTLLLQAQADSSLLSLIREAQWKWPSREEVHGHKASISCADDIERCRLCVHHALCRSLPAALREKYVQHDHAYYENVTEQRDSSSIIEAVVQSVIERNYAVSLSRLWQRSTVKNNLFQKRSGEANQRESRVQNEEMKNVNEVYIEDMETSHRSSTAKFDEVEILAETCSSDGTSLSLLEMNDAVNDDEVNFSGHLRDNKVFFRINDNEVTSMIGTDKPGKKERQGGSTSCLSNDLRYILSSDVNHPDGHLVEYVVVKGKNSDGQQNNERDDDEDILEISMDILNGLVQRTHDRVETAKKKMMIARGMTAQIEESDSKGNEPFDRIQTSQMERRTTRGLKIDFVKLDSYEDDGYNERVDYGNTITSEGRSSLNANKMLAVGKKRKAKGLRVAVLNKFPRRESAVESDIEDSTGNQTEDNSDESAHIFVHGQNPQLESFQESTDPATCVCVACDPKMIRLRRQANYLYKSDFFKIAHYIHLLRGLDDTDELLNQKELDQQMDTVSIPSSSSDEDSLGSPSQATSESALDSCSSASTVVASGGVIDEQNNAQIFDCIFCNEKFASSQNLQQHFVVHEFKGGRGPISSRCSVCDILFRDLRIMDGVLYHVPGEHHSKRRDRHERRHRANALNCVYPQCRNYVFGTRQRLAAHMELHRQAVMNGGVERWQLQDRRDVLKDQLGQLHISCEFCLAEFNWSSRTSGISTHFERFTRHKERHMHYEVIGQPWHCALEGCQGSFEDQLALEEHMWLEHAVNCYCVTCDWIVWGDPSDVQMHRKNCKGFSTSSTCAESIAKKDVTAVPNKVLVKAIKVSNLNDISKQSLQQSLVVKSDAARANGQLMDGRGELSSGTAATKQIISVLPVDPSIVKSKGRPKLLKNFPREGIARDSNSAASAVHFMNFSFYCDFCGAPFRRHHAKQHQLHVESHLPNRKLVCVFDDCGLSFKKREDLQTHVKTKLSTCRYCGCVLFEGYKKHIYACRVLHEMEKQKAQREKTAQKDPLSLMEIERRRDLSWRNDGQLVTNTGILQADEAQTEFLRNLGLAKGTVESIREKERLREKLRSQTYVANGKGRRSCTLSVSCSRCRQVFRNSLNLKQHIREYHDDATNH